MSDAAENTGLSDGEVAAWLAANPDFLQRHPELLRELLPPSRFSPEEERAGVVDMQEYMVGRLQDQLNRAQDSHDALIQSARSNLSSQQQVHQAVLAMLEARDLEEFIHIVTRDLPLVLDVDAISLCAEGGRSAESGHGALFVLPKGAIDELLGPGRDVLLREAAANADRLFGPAAALVRSDALVRLTLTGTAPPALLALGSREVARFHPGQGTELLAFFAEAAARCLRRWLDLPPG